MLKFYHQNKLNILFLLGFICFISGLGYAFINYAFDAVAITLIIVGIVDIVISIFLFSKIYGPIFSMASMSRFLKQAIFFLSALAVLIGVNYAVYQNNIRLDVTKLKQHTLSEYTHDLIHSIDQSIRLTAFYVGLPPKYLEDLLNEYNRISNGNIRFEIVDPIAQIGYAAQFGNMISGEEKKLIVQLGERRQDIDFSNDPLTEELLNNALLRVTRKARKAYFLAGHGEYDIYEDKPNGLNMMAKLLMANNIIPSNLLLDVDGGIPKDCDVLIIAGAKDHLTEKEESLINEYLEKGGDALFLIEHIIVSTKDKPITEDQENKNPSLNNILNNWGVQIGNDIVVDLASHASGDVGSPATRNYMAHRAIVKNVDYTFYIRPRSISLVKDRRETLKVAPFILTSSDKVSWAETDRYLNVKFDDLDRPGPIPIGYIVFEPKEEAEPSDTRIVVITDSDFITNAYIDSYSNAEMGLSVINWLTELEYKVLTDKKEVEVEKLDLTSRQKKTIAFILFFMPFIPALGGFLVWIRHIT